MKLKHFENAEAVLDYIMAEIVATLEDDYERMRGEERSEYTNEDRATMKKKISDINAVIPFIRLETVNTCSECKSTAISVWFDEGTIVGVQCRSCGFYNQN